MQSIHDYEPREVVLAMRAQRAHTLATLEALPERRWNTIVTPGWRVREVAAHLISTDEAALTGRLLRLGFARVPIERVEEWNDAQVARWANKPIPALLHALDLWGRRLARTIGAPPRALSRARIPTPFGRVSPAWLGMLRVYDEWVHDEDLRRALDLPEQDAALEAAARHLFALIATQTVPRLDPNATGSITLDLTDFGFEPFGLDLGAHRYGVGVGGEGARISGKAADVIMVAAGREDWRSAEEAGRLRVDGPRAPAEAFLDVLLAV